MEDASDVIEVPLSARPSSLKARCFCYIVHHIDDFSTLYLSRLPERIRRDLLISLPVIQVCKMERGGMSLGLDMNEIWRQLCENRLGSLVVTSPSLVNFCTRTRSHRDIFWAHLWQAVVEVETDRNSERNARIWKAFVKSLFDSYLTSSNQVYPPEPIAPNHCSTTVDKSKTLLSSFLINAWSLRPHYFIIDNWEAVDVAMKREGHLFSRLLMEVEALVLRAGPTISTADILQELVIDTAFYSREHRVRLQPFYLEQAKTVTGLNRRIEEVLGIVSGPNTALVALHLERTARLDLINASKLVELHLVLDGCEVLDSLFIHLSLLVAELARNGRIESLEVSMALSEQTALEWRTFAYYPFTVTSLVSLARQEQTRALCLRGLLTGGSAQLLIEEFLSIAYANARTLQIGPLIEPVQDCASEITCNAVDYKTIKLHHCAGLARWLLNSNVRLQHLVITECTECFQIPAARISVKTVALLLSGSGSFISDIPAAAIPFSDLFEASTLRSLSLMVDETVAGEVASSILRDLSSALRLKSPSLETLMIHVESEIVDERILQQTFEAIMELSGLDTMQVVIHWQCAEVSRISFINDMFRSGQRKMPLTFHICGRNFAFNISNMFNVP